MYIFLYTILKLSMHMQSGEFADLLIGLLIQSKVDQNRFMAKPQGSHKTGGRSKGTPNKKTLVLHDALEKSGLDVVAKLAELLPRLSEEKQADVLMNFLSYLYPKRKSVELSAHEIDAGPQVIVTLPANGTEYYG